MMTINNQDNRCLRCHIREKLLETFKKCSYCSKKHCHQCWTELQASDEYKNLINNTNQRRICSTCIQNLLQHITMKKSHQKNLTGVDNNDDDYQLALAIALSQKEADEKQNQKRDEIKIEIKSNKNDNLLDKTAEAIERFMNRAKSNYQRNRDVIGDTALLSAFILLQTCATELEQLKDDLDHQRQHFETLQEKLTTIRDAREALNILRYEYQENKRQEQKHLEQQRRLIMMQKVADLRQFKHTQIANFQQLFSSFTR